MFDSFQLIICLSKMLICPFEYGTLTSVAVVPYFNHGKLRVRNEEVELIVVSACVQTERAVDKDGDGAAVLKSEYERFPFCIEQVYRHVECVRTIGNWQLSGHTAILQNMIPRQVWESDTLICRSKRPTNTCRNYCYNSTVYVLCQYLLPGQDSSITWTVQRLDILCASFKISQSAFRILPRDTFSVSLPGSIKNKATLSRG